MFASAEPRVCRERKREQETKREREREEGREGGLNKCILQLWMKGVELRQPTNEVSGNITKPRGKGNCAQLRECVCVSEWRGCVRVWVCARCSVIVWPKIKCPAMQRLKGLRVVLFPSLFASLLPLSLCLSLLRLHVPLSLSLFPITAPLCLTLSPALYLSASSSPPLSFPLVPLPLVFMTSLKYIAFKMPASVCMWLCRVQLYVYVCVCLRTLELAFYALAGGIHYSTLSRH